DHEAKLPFRTVDGGMHPSFFDLIGEGLAPACLLEIE
ncbi:unnamed protein product, partial [marine sediment metagenome]